MSELDQTVPELVDWVKQNDFSINLTPERLAFLLSISVLSQEKYDEELHEAELIDAFRLVCEGFEQSSDLINTRANNAINELVSTRLLTRFTSEFMEGESIYRLSSLSLGICDYYARHQKYSSLKLSIQLCLVASEIDKALSAAAEDGDAEFWRRHVFAVLKYSVLEIFERIDLNQRAMDEQQQHTKEKIAALLSQDWQTSILNCEMLLDETSNILRELQDTLQSAGDELQTQLLNIQECIAEREDLRFVEQMIVKLQLKLDRIVGWGQQAIDLWIGYDKHVHKFVRNAIDMDKNRAFSQRLRQSVVEYLDAPWFLTFANGKKLRELRDEEQVLKNDEVLGEMPQEVEFEAFSVVDSELEHYVCAMLQDHKTQGTPIDLAHILQGFLTAHPRARHFDLARLVIDQAVRLGYAQSELNAIAPEWKAINNYGAKVQANVIDKY